MIFIEKSAKPNFIVKYKESETRKKIKTDFFDICYLCERNASMDWTIDHFLPQEPHLKLANEWTNLYFCCSKCNGIKSNSYNNLPDTNILDCCKKTEANLIELEIDYNTRKVKIETTNLDKNLEQKVENTIDLLEKIYNGEGTTSPFHEDLQKEIIARVAVLVDIIEEFKTKNILSKISERKIIKHINLKTIKENQEKLKQKNEITKLEEQQCFISFKRTLIKKDSHLKAIFEKYFD